MSEIQFVDGETRGSSLFVVAADAITIEQCAILGVGDARESEQQGKREDREDFVHGPINF